MTKEIYLKKNKKKTISAQSQDQSMFADHPIFQELREGLWLNRATRLVVLDFTFYNANINIFSIVKLAIEYLPVGGFLLNPQVTTVQVRTLECIETWLLSSPVPAMRWIHSELQVTAVRVRIMQCKGITVIFSTCHEVDSFWTPGYCCPGKDHAV